MKIKTIWIIEIIVWILVIASGMFFFIYNSAVKENAKNIYYIFFDDANGLVNGSPVRMMGINIGYVKDIKIFDNKVFISFLVTKDGIKIPNRTSASTQFYGLGGSTSLELDPSTASNEPNQAAILPAESYRVQDFWDGQALVANVMIDIYGGIGRTIQSADLINNKQYLKQSSLVRSLNQTTNGINTAQNVVIYKLSENTNKYLKEKNIGKIEEEEVMEDE